MKNKILFSVMLTVAFSILCMDPHRTNAPSLKEIKFDCVNYYKKPFYLRYAPDVADPESISFREIEIPYRHDTRIDLLNGIVNDYCYTVQFFASISFSVSFNKGKYSAPPLQVVSFSKIEETDGTFKPWQQLAYFFKKDEEGHIPQIQVKFNADIVNRDDVTILDSDTTNPDEQCKFIDLKFSSDEKLSPDTCITIVSDAVRHQIRNTLSPINLKHLDNAFAYSMHNQNP